MTGRLVRSPDVVARKIGDEVILVPIRNDVGDLQCIYSLNEVGAFIWERLEESGEPQSLVELICREFEVSAEEASRDLGEFLGELEKVGAVSAN